MWAINVIIYDMAMEHSNKGEVTKLRVKKMNSPVSFSLHKLI